VTDESRRRELGIAFDELEAEPELVGHGAQQRALAGAGRTFEQHMPVGGQRGHHQLDFAMATDDVGQYPIDEPAERERFSHER
jgi:hypothetical protein